LGVEGVVCKNQGSPIIGCVILLRWAQSIRTADSCNSPQIIFKQRNGITTLREESNHLPRTHMEVIIVGAKSTQAEKLAVRNSTFAVIRMESGRKMKVVMSISSLVEDRRLNPIIRNA